MAAQETLVEGSTFAGSLGEYVRLAGALPPAHVLDLMGQLADALGDAHARGIVHRDLGPESLFLDGSRLEGTAQVLKILDIGAADGAPGDQWRAPELAQPDAEAGPRTDVWTLGLITFQLLTARSYWLATNHPDLDLSALLLEKTAAPLETPSKRASALRARSLPPGFDGWFARCVHRDPDQRFADARAAVDALASVLSGPGVPVAPTAVIPLGAVPSSPDGPLAATMAIGEVPRAQKISHGRQPASTAGTVALAVGAGMVALLAVAGLWALNQPADPEPEPYPDVPQVDPYVPVPIPPTVGDARDPRAVPLDVAGPPPNAERTPSGLASLVVRTGTGSLHPGPTDRVTVHYTGWTTDGEQFDSSHARDRPTTFGLDQVIAGWTEGVQLMVEGEERRLWIPENLAYEGRPSAPQGMLVFDVELIRFEPR